MVFIGIVYELVEAFTGALHVHACQGHSIPRLIAESPFVDPPAVDGRQTIDDASIDREFRVGDQFRETNRGYGIPQSPPRREQAHRRSHRDTVERDTPQRHVRVNRAGQYLP